MHVREILDKYDIDWEGDIDTAIDRALANRECNYALYEHYFEDMPYGTQKARDGDPDEFILRRLEVDLLEE